MNDLRLALRQSRFEHRAFWRNPPAAFFTFIFPLMFLFLFNLLFGDETFLLAGREVRSSQFFVPAIAAFSIVSACFTNVAMSVTFARDQGVLKRIRGTPLPAWAFLFGRIALAMWIAVLVVAIATAAGATLFGVAVPWAQMPVILLTLVIGGGALAALGLTMSAAVPNADAAPAVVNGVVLPLLFISDVFIRLDRAPAWLLTLGDIFPIKHLSHALIAAYDPFPRGIQWGDLGVMAAWGVAGTLLAMRFFSWEPRR